MGILELEPRPPHPGTRGGGPASALSHALQVTLTCESAILRAFQPLPSTPRQGIPAFLTIASPGSFQNFHLRRLTAASAISLRKRKRPSRFTDAGPGPRAWAKATAQRWQHPGLLLPRGGLSPRHPESLGLLPPEELAQAHRSGRKPPSGSRSLSPTSSRHPGRQHPGNINFARWLSKSSERSHTSGRWDFISQ